MATIEQLEAYGYCFRQHQSGQLLELQPEYEEILKSVLYQAFSKQMSECMAVNLGSQLFVDIRWQNPADQTVEYQQWFIDEHSRPLPEPAITILGGLAMAKDCVTHHRKLDPFLDLARIAKDCLLYRENYAA